MICFLLRACYKLPCQHLYICKFPININYLLMCLNVEADTPHVGNRAVNKLEVQLESAQLEVAPTHWITKWPELEPNFRRN